MACLGERVDMSHFYDFHHPTGSYAAGCPLTTFSQLPPASLHEHISPAPMLITRRHPYGMWTGRHFPAARSPYIGVAVPAVIPADPHMIAAWPGDARLHDGMWRTGPYYYFICIGRAHQQAEPQQRTYNDLAHFGVSSTRFICTDIAKENIH